MSRLEATGLRVSGLRSQASGLRSQASGLRAQGSGLRPQDAAQPLLILIRGLPGSGKTTLSARLAAALDDTGAAERLEVDDWLPNRRASGVSPAELRAAHAACRRAVGMALDNGRDVLVSNCFVRAYGPQLYARLAGHCGAVCLIAEPDGAWNLAQACRRLARRDGSNWIGEETMLRMLADAAPSELLASWLGCEFLSAAAAEERCRAIARGREEVRS